VPVLPEFDLPATSLSANHVTQAAGGAMTTAPFDFDFDLSSVEFDFSTFLNPLETEAGLGEGPSMAAA
jgi:hypothetical protein